MKRSPISIILPTLNENENIGPLIRKLISLVNPCEIIVVDDNSDDGTQETVQKTVVKFPQVRIIKQNVRKGLTKSIQKGIDRATSEYIAWMDADFSHPPETLKKMVQYIPESEIVIGSWLCSGGKDARDEKLIKIMSYSVNKICRILFDKNITAYTSGFILIKANCLENFRLRGDYGEYFIDLLVRKAREKFKIIEVPFVCSSRTKGLTKTAPSLKIYFKRGVKYMKMIFSLYVQQ